MIVSKSDREKIFENIKHYADLEGPSAKTSVYDLIVIKSNLSSLIINFIQTDKIFSFIRSHFEDKDFSYFFGRSLRSREGYMLYVKLDDEVLAKIIFNTTNLHNIFDLLQDLYVMDKKDKTLPVVEVELLTKLRGRDDIKSIWLEAPLNSEIEKIENSYIYLKNKEHTENLFTLKEYIENKKDVLEHLKLNNY